MNLFVYNTLNKTKEKFVPIKHNEPSLYVCGPTVYSYAHLGNARSVVIYDILYRLLKSMYDKVFYIRNITDVDDKIINVAEKTNSSVADVANFYANAFYTDMRSLYCLEPTAQPLATEHIQEMISMISDLDGKGYVYEAKGDIFFDVTSYADYGKLSGSNLNQIEAGARVAVLEHKKHPADFVLWKRANDGKIAWNSPWGLGRPGWHIECAAMSSKYLGSDFDIHGGGVDLQFPHHENEIACCAATNGQFARYWVHSGFLTVDSEKMSKSIGNVITVNDLISSGVRGEVIRYALLMTHYHKPLDWNERFLLTAKKSLNKLYSAFLLATNNNFPSQSGDDISPNSEVLSALRDDLNTPKALSVLHDLAGKMNKCDDLKTKSIIASELKKSAEFCGLFNFTVSDWYAKDPDSEVELLIQKRHEARQRKDYALADIIRTKLRQKNIALQDNNNGITDWYRDN